MCIVGMYAGGTQGLEDLHLWPRGNVACGGSDHLENGCADEPQGPQLDESVNLIVAIQWTATRILLWQGGFTAARPLPGHPTDSQDPCQALMLPPAEHDITLAFHR